MTSKTEIWKSHPDINGIEVSSFGRVRSVKGHYYKNCRNKDSYLIVCFRVNGKLVNKKVHRLVAETFIPNPNDLPFVNHKDGDRTNNNASNLEWCTASYNSQYREKHGRSLGVPVIAVNLKTQEVSQFASRREAGNILGLLWQNISAVIRGKQKQIGGFWFTNADEKAADIIKRKLNGIKGDVKKWNPNK